MKDKKRENDIDLSFSNSSIGDGTLAAAFGKTAFAVLPQRGISMKITIEIPGILTTVQDEGRYGYMEYGVRTSGAMDQDSFHAANRIVGNDENAAELEMTLMGITAVFEGDGVIALAGADMNAQLDGMPVERYAAVRIRSGQRLSMGMARSGCRAYLAVSGGIAVPKVMGSCSTDVKCQLGGLEGRALQKGDVLETGSTGESAKEEKLEKARWDCPRKYGHFVRVRVVEGPQADWFSEEARKKFFQETYHVSAESDRMGMRLDGAPVDSLHGMDIVSDGIAFGSIQITKSGMPIVMMADHQTTGGYAKIGTVCSFDLPKLAQLLPGDSVQFEKVSVEEAQELYLHPQERNRTKPLALAVRKGAEKEENTSRRHRFQKYNYYYRHGI